MNEATTPMKSAQHAPQQQASKPERQIPKSLLKGGGTPVKTVKFRSPTDIPGEQAANNVRPDQNRRGRHQWTAAIGVLEGGAQMLEVMFLPSDQTKPVEVGLIPLSEVSIVLV